MGGPAIFKTPANQQYRIRPYSACRAHAVLPMLRMCAPCVQASEGDSKPQVQSLRKGVVSFELSYARFGRLSRTSCSPKEYVSLQNSQDTCIAPQQHFSCRQC